MALYHFITQSNNTGSWSSLIITPSPTLKAIFSTCSRNNLIYFSRHSASVYMEEQGVIPWQNITCCQTFSVCLGTLLLLGAQREPGNSVPLSRRLGVVCFQNLLAGSSLL